MASFSCREAGAPAHLGICASISSLIATTGFGAPVVTAVFSACVTGFRAGIVFCSIYEGVGVDLPPGADNPVDIVCHNAANRLAPFLEDLLFLEEVTVTATAYFPFAFKASGSVTYQPEDGSVGPPIFLESPGIVILQDFEVNPPYPFEGEGYSVSVSLRCARKETIIWILVYGTDGYTDFKQCDGINFCSLYVRGEDEIDEFEFSADPPDYQYVGAYHSIEVWVKDDSIGLVKQTTGIFFRAKT